MRFTRKYDVNMTEQVKFNFTPSQMALLGQATQKLGMPLVDVWREFMLSAAGTVVTGSPSVVEGAGAAFAVAVSEVKTFEPVKDEPKET